MKRRLTPRDKRTGAVIPLTAILLVPILAMVAFSVDTGWVTHTENQLQSAADAAALAGAGQLASGFTQYYLPGQGGGVGSALEFVLGVGDPAQVHGEGDHGQEGHKENRGERDDRPGLDHGFEQAPQPQEAALPLSRPCWAGRGGSGNRSSSHSNRSAGFWP